MCYVFHSNLMQHHCLLRRGLWHTFSQFSITTQAFAVLFRAVKYVIISRILTVLSKMGPEKHSFFLSLHFCRSHPQFQPAKRRGFLPQPRSVQPSVLIASPSSGSNSSSIDLDPENRSGYIQERGMLQSHVTMQDPHTQFIPSPRGRLRRTLVKGQGGKGTRDWEKMQLVKRLGNRENGLAFIGIQNLNYKNHSANL